MLMCCVCLHLCYGVVVTDEQVEMRLRRFYPLLSTDI